AGRRFFSRRKARKGAREDRRRNRFREFHAASVTSHALKSFWKCYDQLPAHVQKLAVRSLRELFVDDLDLLLEHLAGVHTVVARVSRASLQADTAASTDLLDRFFQLRAEHVPQLDRLSTINHQLSGTTRLLLQAARRA